MWRRRSLPLDGRSTCTRAHGTYAFNGVLYGFWIQWPLVRSPRTSTMLTSYLFPRCDVPARCRTDCAYIMSVVTVTEALIGGGGVGATEVLKDGWKWVVFCGCVQVESYVVVRKWHLLKGWSFFKLIFFFFLKHVNNGIIWDQISSFKVSATRPLTKASYLNTKYESMSCKRHLLYLFKSVNLLFCFQTVKLSFSIEHRHPHLYADPDEIFAIGLIKFNKSLKAFVWNAFKQKNSKNICFLNLFLNDSVGKHFKKYCTWNSFRWQRSFWTFRKVF